MYSQRRRLAGLLVVSVCVCNILLAAWNVSPLLWARSHNYSESTFDSVDPLNLTAPYQPGRHETILKHYLFMESLNMFSSHV